MHETKGAKYYVDKDQYRYAENEANLVQDIGSMVARYTQKNYGKAIRPWMALFIYQQPQDN